MRDKSSPADAVGVVWRRTRIAWPVERVPVVVEVAHPRKLTALEWVVLRVVEAFGDELPYLDEVAEELGIADPAFLLDTLRDVVRLRALEPRLEEGSRDRLPDLRFTAMGRELFRKGQIEAEPAEHGLELYFDALTDEARRAPPGLQDWTEVPFPPGQPTPEPRSAVGLDRSREIIRKFHAELLRGDGEVRTIQPSPTAWPRTCWATVEVELRLTPGGEMVPHGSGLTPAAQRLLQETDLDETFVPRRAITAAWTVAADRVCRSRLPYDAWCSLIQRTLPEGTADAEVLRLLQGHPSEVLLHAGWADRPGVAARLGELARGGTRVAVLGAPNTEVTPLPDTSKPGVLVHVAGSGALPAAVVVDGRVGLLADEVVLRLGSASPPVELAGLLNGRGCEQARQQLLQGIATGLRSSAPPKAIAPPVLAPSDDVEARGARVLDDEELRRRLARFAFLRGPDDLAGCMLRVSECAAGPERVWALSRVGRLAARWDPSLSEPDSQAPSREAWDTLVEQLGHLDRPREFVDLLARIAPPGASPEALVSAAARQPRSVGADDLVATTDALVAMRGAVDTRWGKGTCARLPAFVAARDAVLSHDVTGDLAARVTAAKRLLSSEELRTWAGSAAERLSEPGSAEELGAWADEANVLREYQPSAIDELATDHLRRLLRDQPTSLPGLARAGARLLPAQTLLTSLFDPNAGPRELGSVCRALASAGVRLDGGAVRGVVEQLLPDSTTLPSVAASDGQLADLVALTRDQEHAGPAVRAWAARCAGAIPRAEAPQALPWWLTELGNLRPLLDDLPDRASRAVSPFANALDAARERGDPSWDDVLSTWRDLGMTEEALVALVRTREGRSANTPPGPGGNKKKGRKRR